MCFFLRTGIEVGSEEGEREIYNSNFSFDLAFNLVQCW